MIIAQRINIDDIVANSELLHDVGDYLEIQMLEKNSLQENLQIIKVGLRQFTALKKLIINLSSGNRYLDYMICAHGTYNRFNSFLDEIILLSKQYGLEINVVVTLFAPVDSFIRLNGLWFLTSILKKIEDTDVNLLLENNKCILGNGNLTSNVFELFSVFNEDKFRVYLNLYNIQIGELIYNTNFSIPPKVIDKVHCVEFSKASDVNGISNYPVRYTGVHLGIRDCVKDIDYLKGKGLDVDNIVIINGILTGVFGDTQDIKEETCFLKYINSSNILHKKSFQD